MDRERLGRALGNGARAAVRTAIEAAEAATADPPRAASAPRQAAPASPQNHSGSTQRSFPQAIILPPETAKRVAPAARNAAKSVAGPLKKASRALWHELTGSFFALFALSFALGTWHDRSSATSPIANDRYHFYAFCTFTLVFTYFSVSSFMRAKSRD
jgi:hypothetical protein